MAAEYASKASDAVKEGWKVAQDKAGKAAEATSQAVSVYVVAPVNKGMSAAADLWKAGIPPEMAQMWKDKLSQIDKAARSAAESVNTTVTLWLGQLKLELLKYMTETTLRYLGAGVLGCGTLYLGSRLVFRRKTRRAITSRAVPLQSANGEANGVHGMRRQMVPSESIQARVPAMKVAMKQLGLAPGDSVLVAMHAIEVAEVQTWCTACQAKAVYVDSSVVPKADFIKDYILSLRPKLVFYDVSLISDVVKIEEGVRAGSADTAGRIAWIFAAPSFPQKAWALDQTPKHIKHMCYLDWCSDAVKTFEGMSSAKRSEELVYFESTPKQPGHDENVIEALVNNVNQNVQQLSKLFTPSPSKDEKKPAGKVDW